ncbi:unnamed protein product [Camellia sinensis]
MRENYTQGENRHGDDGATSALEDEELSGIGAIVGGNLATGGVPDDKELGGDSGGRCGA